MPVREGPPQPPPKDVLQPYPAEKARGAEIILGTHTRRIVFFSGLVGIVLLLLVLALLG